MLAVSMELYSEIDPDVLSVFIGYFATMLLVSLAFSLTLYILYSLGLYSIAKRRGLYRPWRSWLPIGRSGIIGGISDDYLYMCKDKERDWDKLLAKLELASWGLGAIWVAVLPTFIEKFFAFQILKEQANEIEARMARYSVDSRRYIQCQKLLDTIVGRQEVEQNAVLFILSLMLLILVAMIVIQVLFYKAHYDLFASCRPEQKVIFLVLSILFPVTLPFFVFACRKYDLGMQEQPKQENSIAGPWADGQVFTTDP